jgi:thioredoxin reductase (NADPH)
MLQHNKLIILGSGPAGYTAAIYAARAGLTPMLITGMEQGGQLTRTHMVDNWPGDVNGVSGIDLMERMSRHAERFETKFIYDQIISAKLENKPFLLNGEGGQYTCDALIIATGASVKYLGLDSEKQFIGKGVSGCAVCDGYFYKGKNVAVVGGGDTAAEDAIYLTEVAAQVTLIHRRDQLAAQPFFTEKLLNLEKSGKLKIAWDSVVEEVLGDAKGVNGVRIKNVKDSSMHDLVVEGLFVATGQKPNSLLFSGQLEMTANGFIKTKRGVDVGFTATNIPGVFAAGDVADPNYRQAITAAASGCMAAKDVKRYLDSI